MKDYQLAALILLCGEIFATIIFYLLRKTFNMHSGKHARWDWISGIMERVIVLFGLCLNITQIVAMFGVFKVAARLKSDDSTTEKKTNDYFLIGNFLSVGLALGYFYIYTKLRAH